VCTSIRVLKRQPHLHFNNQAAIPNCTLLDSLTCKGQQGQSQHPGGAAHWA
jgi:hypothetical protein